MCLVRITVQKSDVHHSQRSVVDLIVFTSTSKTWTLELVEHLLSWTRVTDTRYAFTIRGKSEQTDGVIVKIVNLSRGLRRAVYSIRHASKAPCPPNPACIMNAVNRWAAADVPGTVFSESVIVCYRRRGTSSGPLPSADRDAPMPPRPRKLNPSERPTDALSCCTRPSDTGAFQATRDPIAGTAYCTGGRN